MGIMGLKGYGGYSPKSPDKIIKCDFGLRVSDFFAGRFGMKYIVHIKRNERADFIDDIFIWASMNLRSGWRIMYHYRPRTPPKLVSLNAPQQNSRELTFKMAFSNPAEAARFKLEFV